MVENCTARGLRLRSAALDRAIDVRMASCRVTSNGAEGASLSGAFELWVEGSLFSGNQFEGLDLGDLLSPDGVPARLRVRDCAFVGNGQEGLDCNMAAPPAPGAAGGLYQIEITNSSFERNGAAGLASASAGLNLDIDFELVPGWRAEIELRGLLARANAGDGIHLDLDSTCTALVHRTLCSANGGDGLRVTSETTSSFVSASACAFVGNSGAGVRASLGNVAVVGAHDVVAGNAQGGYVSGVLECAETSGVAWLQAAPFSATRAHFGVVADDPFDAPFEHAALAFARTLEFDGTFLRLDDASALQLGDRVELDDDGLLRVVAGFASGGRVRLDPQPTAPMLPGSVARLEPFGGATEDYRLAPLSAAAAAGMPAPGGAPDAGPFGAPHGAAPGWEEEPLVALFRAATCDATVGGLVAANQVLRVGFAGGDLDALSVGAQSVRVRDAAGVALAVTAFEQGAELVVQPPAGGWPSGALMLELHTGLRSTAGEPLACPLGLPFRRP